MAYRIEFRPSTEAALENLPRSEQQNIRRRLDQLAETPRPPGATRLVGFPYWRFRVGKYRVVYEIRDAERRLIIVRIAPRGDVYRGLE